jgi:predicted dehydrogenase
MPCFIETRRIVQSGEIGDVILIQLEASAGPNPVSTAMSWRTDPSIAGLGTTFSVGVHVYDILRFILGSEIVSVSSFFDTPRGVMEKTNLSTFRFANGVMAQVNVNETTPHPHNDYTIYGTRGRITGRGLTRSRFSGEIHVSIGGGETRRMEFPTVNAHQGSVTAFSKALLEGREPSPSGIDGLKSVQLCEAMARSAWDGVHVTLP